jgi:hypothetical protein
MMAQQEGSDRFGILIVTCFPLPVRLHFSVLPPKADIAWQRLDVRFVPKADIGTVTLAACRSAYRARLAGISSGFARIRPRSSKPDLQPTRAHRRNIRLLDFRLGSKKRKLRRVHPKSAFPQEADIRQSEFSHSGDWTALSQRQKLLELAVSLVSGVSQCES